MTGETDPLTIGDLAARTGLTPATLRMWEQRHGFPVPQRLESGHRRYAESDVLAVRRVRERQEGGVRLDRAISQVLDDADRAARPAARRSTPSCAAATPTWPRTGSPRARCSRCRGPSRTSSWPRPTARHLFGSFQRGRYFVQSQARWPSWPASPAAAYVLGDFEDGSDAPPEVVGRRLHRAGARAPARRRPHAARVGRGLRLRRPARRPHRLGAAGPGAGARPRPGLRVRVDHRPRRRARRLAGLRPTSPDLGRPGGRPHALRARRRPPAPGSPTWPR